jgi:hypothetical protein
MRKLLLGLAIGIGSLLVGGSTVALIAIAVLVPLAGSLHSLRPVRPNGPGMEKAPGRPGLFR